MKESDPAIPVGTRHTARSRRHSKAGWRETVYRKEAPPHRPSVRPDSPTRGGGNPLRRLVPPLLLSKTERLVF